MDHADAPSTFGRAQRRLEREQEEGHGMPLCCWSSPAAYGGRVASFYQKLAANFDLIFFNTSDRDSDYKVRVWGQPSANACGVLPHLIIFRQYIAAICQATGRK